MFVNYTLETWSIECCVLLFESTFKLFCRLESICSLRLCARITKLSRIVNARGLETRNFLNSRHFNVRFSIEQRMALGWILRSHFAPILWSHVSNCCAGVRFFPLRNGVHFTWGVLCWQEEGKNTWEICLNFVHTSVFHATRLIAQIFSPPMWLLMF